jgi:sucrose phosphorylase
MIRLRNTSPAFGGKLSIGNTDEHQLEMSWAHEGSTVTLTADLRDFSFSITDKGMGREPRVMAYF